MREREREKRFDDEGGDEPSVTSGDVFFGWPRIEEYRGPPRWCLPLSVEKERKGRKRRLVGTRLSVVNGSEEKGLVSENREDARE